MYTSKKADMLKISDPSRERVTRKQTVDKFTVEDAVDIVNSYTDSLWEAVDNRIQYAGLEDMSSCAFSEAPAEGVFSVYQRVTKGRESLTLAHASALTRVSMHGPPVATADSAELAKSALEHFSSHLGERFCTLFWFKEKASATINKQQKLPWNW